MTTRKLARLAEVSSATVSLALRNHPRISAATKARILRLVRKHHYVVDGRVTELMRSIRKHSASELTGCLGLISLYLEERPWLAASDPICCGSTTARSNAPGNWATVSSRSGSKIPR